MKKVFILALSLLTLSSAFASGLKTKIECTTGDVKVVLSSNINEADQTPMAMVTVYKNGLNVYSNVYEMVYFQIEDLESWGYHGHEHVDGIISVAAKSQTEASANFFIRLSNTESVDGAEVSCTLQR